MTRTSREVVTIFWPMQRKTQGIIEEHSLAGCATEAMSQWQIFGACAKGPKHNPKSDLVAACRGLWDTQGTLWVPWLVPSKAKSQKPPPALVGAKYFLCDPV